MTLRAQLNGAEFNWREHSMAKSFGKKATSLFRTNVLCMLVASVQRVECTSALVAC